MGSCVYYPTITNSKGEEVRSKLFGDLYKFTGNNRERAKDLYLQTKNSDFIRDWNPKLTLDENGEPTIQSLFKKVNLAKVIPQATILETLNKSIGSYNSNNTAKKYLYNDQVYEALMDKAIEFNKGEFGDNYVANVFKKSDSESTRLFYGIKVSPRNKLKSIDSNKSEYNYKLNEILRDKLANYGISIGALTELEKRLGVSGVTDFDIAQRATEGIVEMIRLSEGISGEKALPEEFAHFAIEAMTGDPIITRLLNLISNNGLTKEILGDEYSTYKETYNGDEIKLVKEAAGKLLAKHLLGNTPIENNNPYANFLTKVIKAVKEFFSKLSANDFKSAIYVANKDVGRLATSLLSGKLDDRIKISNISSSEAYYNLKNRIDRDQKILGDMKKGELKRLEIYNKRSINPKFTQKQELLIDELEFRASENEEIEGIYSFCSNAMDELKKVDSKLVSIMQDNSSSINQKCAVLRDIKNYMSSYGNILKDVRKALREEEKETDNRYGARIRVVVDSLTSLLDDLEVDYNEVATPLFLEFIKPFIGDSMAITMGKDKGKTLKIEDLLKSADRDISFFERWLDSMADSSDTMLKIMDQMVKERHEAARLRTIELSKIIKSAGIKLEQSGIKNTDWMFEKDSKGNKTGRYISEINLALYEENRQELFERLRTKYGENPIGVDAENYKKEKREWFNKNTEVVNDKRSPRLLKYESKEFKLLNSAQKEFYNKIIELKGELEASLPDSEVNLFKAVQSRKDVVERIKHSDSVKKGTTEFWESMKETVLTKVDDTDFGTRNTIIDFSGKEVQSLPIYYTKKLENPNDISTDVVSTMVAYAAMATDYVEMSKIIDTLEVGRDLLNEREVAQTQGGKQIVEKFKSVGRSVENKLLKQKGKSHLEGRLESFFSMQVYGRYMKDEGNLGKTNISVGKAANLVNKMTSVNTIALNSLMGVSNVATGDVMMKIESFSGEFFKPKDVIAADKIYATELPKILSQIGNRVQDSKIGLWAEKLNVLQDYAQSVKETNFDRKTKFSRLFSTSTLFFMSSAGEHWMQIRTSLALANTYKMKSPNGKLVSLYDAMEVVYLDPNNKALGSKLELKEGYTNEDGSQFTNEDLIKFSKKSAAINERMHGIYNKADMSAIQNLALGRMVMMFRKWMRPAFKRRFANATYNHDLDAWTEGYYLTTGKFLLQLTKDLKDAQFNLVSKWGDLNITEKANLRRALVELSHFGTISLLLSILSWDDNDDRPWLARMTEYQLRRLRTEIGSQIPGLPMVQEGKKLLQSPAAGVRTIEGILSLVNLLNPFSYINEVEHGRYKGHSEAYKNFFDSPVVPFNKTIYRSLHPEESLSFYK